MLTDDEMLALSGAGAYERKLQAKAERKKYFGTAPRRIAFGFAVAIFITAMAFVFENEALLSIGIGLGFFLIPGYLLFAFIAWVVRFYAEQAKKLARRRGRAVLTPSGEHLALTEDLTPKAKAKADEVIELWQPTLKALGLCVTDYQSNAAMQAALAGASLLSKGRAARALAAGSNALSGGFTTDNFPKVVGIHESDDHYRLVFTVLAVPGVGYQKFDDQAEFLAQAFSVPSIQVTQTAEQRAVRSFELHLLLADPLRESHEFPGFDHSTLIESD